MAVVSVLSSCASSKSTSTVLNGTDLSKYKYVVFGANSDGDAELEDIVMMVQNEHENQRPADHHYNGCGSLSFPPHYRLKMRYARACCDGAKY